ncbi:hypothetical protein AAMO2058_000870500 [Amorphochlora amoebiformis]
MASRLVILAALCAAMGTPRSLGRINGVTTRLSNLAPRSFSSRSSTACRAMGRREGVASITKQLGILGILSSTQSLSSPWNAWGDEDESRSSSEYAAKIYMDVSINEGEPSRIVIGVYSDGSLGEQRFLQLAQGAGPGLDFTRSLFTFVSPDKSFIKNAGVGSITGYGSKDITLAGGKSARGLFSELASQKRKHDKSGIVSLVVRSAEPPPPSTKKLVAEGGRLITVEESPKGYVEPNGSEFVITTKAANYLDETNLVVGEVIEGMDVIDKICQLPTSKPKGKDDPFFKIGKSIGDSRALFVSTRFGRPFARVQVVESGKLA